MEIDVELIQSDAETKPFETNAESKKVAIKYYPLSVSTFACFPQIIIEGTEIDGVDV